MFDVSPTRTHHQWAERLAPRILPHRRAPKSNLVSRPAGLELGQHSASNRPKVRLCRRHGSVRSPQSRPTSFSLELTRFRGMGRGCWGVLCPRRKLFLSLEATNYWRTVSCQFELRQSASLHFRIWGQRSEPNCQFRLQWDFSVRSLSLRVQGPFNPYTSRFTTKLYARKSHG